MNIVMTGLPFLILAGGTLLSFLLLAYKAARYVPVLAVVSVVLALVALVGSLFHLSGNSLSLSNIAQQFTQVTQVTPHIVVDGFTRLYAGLVLLAGLFGMLIQNHSNQEHVWDDAKKVHAMRYVSVLMLLVGALFVVAANGLLVLFLGAEIMGMGTLGLLLFDASLKDRVEDEALTFHDRKHKKHIQRSHIVSTFLRQGVSSSLLLFGFALLFAHSGSVTYSEQSRALLYDTKHPLLLLGALMVLYSLFYKLAYVPMQSWFTRMQQDIHHSTWLPLVMIVQFVTFVGFVRFLAATAVPAVSEVTVVLMVFVILGLVVIAFRLLNASDIRVFMFNLVMAQMALVLVVMLSLGQSSLVVANVLMVAMMLGTLVVSVALHHVLLQNTYANDQTYDTEKGTITKKSTMKDETIKQQGQLLVGLYYHYPKQTVLLSLGLLVLAGLPLTVGFVGKFFTLMATVQGLDWMLMAVTVLASVVIWYAVMKHVRSFFTSPKHLSVDESAPLPKLLSFLTVVLLVFVVVLGVYPEPLIQLSRLAVIG